MEKPWKNITHTQTHTNIHPISTTRNFSKFWVQFNTFKKSYDTSKELQYVPEKKYSTILLKTFGGEIRWCVDRLHAAAQAERRAVATGVKDVSVAKDAFPRRLWGSWFTAINFIFLWYFHDLIWILKHFVSKGYMGWIHSIIMATKSPSSVTLCLNVYRWCQSLVCQGWADIGGEDSWYAPGEFFFWSKSVESQQTELELVENGIRMAWYQKKRTAYHFFSGLWTWMWHTPPKNSHKTTQKWEVCVRCFSFSELNISGFSSR